MKISKKDDYILNVILGRVRALVHRRASRKDDGILYHLKYYDFDKGKIAFKRKFIKLSKARRIFYELYGR